MNVKVNLITKKQSDQNCGLLNHIRHMQRSKEFQKPVKTPAAAATADDVNDGDNMEKNPNDTGKHLHFSITDKPAHCVFVFIC